MIIKVPYLIQDPQITGAKGIDPVEWLTLDQELFCLDGPVSRRVAVLDFDPTTGTLLKGCPFVGAKGLDEESTFGLANLNDITATDFLQVNVFATVLSTLYMFEEEDVLGREVEWAFGAPQLFVIPRAGEWANAFYQRESHSLQFFFFTSSGSASGDTVFTALSQDIIAHETGHAILDGIAPDLYNSITPQSLALHEAVADLTALLVGLRSRRLRERLLSQTNGRIDGLNALSALAEQFGTARDGSRGHYLRSLWNEWNLDPTSEHGVRRTDPHALSEVLSGALYRVFATLHAEYMSARAAQEGIEEFSASGWALYAAREHFKRLVLRSLDYLPPGEVCFADYGRAILASDQASYPGDSMGRSALVEEFVKRRITSTAAELDVDTSYAHPAVADLDLEVLLSSDWAAYEFAEHNRDFLGIPQNVRFRVRPRVRATKKYRGAVDFEEVTECIFRVSWDREEDNPGDLPLPARRQITVGTTLVIDWKSRQVRVLLISDAARPPGMDRQQDDRNEMLRTLVRTHTLGFGPRNDDQPAFDTSARIEASGDLMRVRNSAHMLHLMSERNGNG